MCVYSCSQLRELWFTDLFMYVCMYVCMYVSMYVSMYVHVHVYTHVHVHVDMYIHVSEPQLYIQVNEKIAI